MLWTDGEDFESFLSEIEAGSIMSLAHRTAANISAVGQAPA